MIFHQVFFLESAWSRERFSVQYNTESAMPVLCCSELVDNGMEIAAARSACVMSRCLVYEQRLQAGTEKISN